MLKSPTLKFIGDALGVVIRSKFTANFVSNIMLKPDSEEHIIVRKSDMSYNAYDVMKDVCKELKVDPSKKKKRRGYRHTVKWRD